MYAYINIIIHATEDDRKILDNLFKLLSISDYDLTRMDMTGHYKNPLTMYRIKVRGREARKLLENIIKKLDEVDREYLLSNIDEYIHRRKFYLRLEKNYVCRGKVKLVIKDPIKIVFHNIDKEELLSFS